MPQHDLTHYRDLSLPPFQLSSLQRRPFIIGRHAETEANAKGLVLGVEVDPAISVQGRRNSTKAAGALALWARQNRVELGTIYSSPMRRAEETALAYCQNRGVPGHVLRYNLLAERHMGLFSKWRHSHYRAVSGAIAGLGGEAVLDNVFGLEPTSIMRARTMFAINMGLEATKHLDQDHVPLFVAHSGSCKAVFGALGFDAEDMSVGTNGLYFCEPSSRGAWAVTQIHAGYTLPQGASTLPRPDAYYNSVAIAPSRAPAA